MKETEDDMETTEETRTSSFTEVVSILFVTLVIVFLAVKIFFF
jgi:hypothetical protein